ncbi:MAG: FecR family protein [Chitinophagaceae bacterium]|nr:FecR family protein [Chitinophagaceae bacterium]
MNKEYIIYLLNGWVGRTLTPSELDELTVLLADDTNREAVIEAGAEVFDAAKDAPEFQERLLPYLEKALMIDLAERDNGKTAFQGSVRPIGSPKYFYFKYAAAAVALMCLGAYFYFKQPALQKAPSPLEMPVSQEDRLPGANKATLTLSNGKKIELSAKPLQTIVDEGLVIHNDGSVLSYAESAVVVYNTMRTLNGGQYKLKLADGTKVWLNAASSITYPTSFQGNTREVSITGEAYFEVARDSARPFKVKTYMEEVTVLGTAFNVNSYRDEKNVKISLLHGAVRINNARLEPGESYINGKIGPANLSQDLAWKNGVFNFHQVKLPDAMRQIARWYDVDIHYKGNVESIELGGEIGRDLTLKQLLSGLQDTDVQFDLQGRVLTVSGQQNFN